MNRRLVAVFAFALLVAGFTSFLVYHLLLSHVQTTPRAQGKHKLLVPAHDLQVGALIREDDLQEVSWNGDLSSQVVNSRQELVGRGIVATVYTGEPIMSARLAAKGAGAGLAATIPVGMRAAALRVNEVVGLAGFVVPGMRVDVLVAGTPPGSMNGLQGTLSRTVLQNIEVLSAGQKIDQNAAGKPETAEVVNLLVTPDQAEVLNLATNEAKVQLVLRNPLDVKEQVTHGTSIASLFGQPESRPTAPVSFKRPSLPRALSPVAAAKSPESSGTVEVISGTKKHEQTFDTPGIE